jgi:hypothetical protein
MKKQPKTNKGDSLLFKSSILTSLVVLVLIIMRNMGTINDISFWFFSAPLYFFFIAFLYSLLIDKKGAINSKSFFSLYPVLILVKLILTASFIVLYTELNPNPKISFWVLMVVLYFTYSTLIAITLYRSN